MLTESEVKKELFNSEYLWRLQNGSRQYTKEYWQAGYSQALKVVLGEKQSEIIKKIKEITDFDTLVNIMGDSNGDIQN